MILNKEVDFGADAESALDGKAGVASWAAATSGLRLFQEVLKLLHESGLLGIKIPCFAGVGGEVVKLAWGFGVGFRQGIGLEFASVVVVSARTLVRDVFPGAATNRERARAPKGLCEQIWAYWQGGLPFEDGKKVEAVLGGIAWQVSARDGGCRGHHIGEAGELVAGGAGLNAGWPAHDERHAMSAFPGIAFDAAPRFCAIVGVMGAHVHDGGGFGSVVAAEDDERVVG